MFRGEKVLAIIPARKGSKGLPNKNMIELNGKPLIHWTIMSSLKSSFIDDTLVTSDSKEILKYAKVFKIFLKQRPIEFAQDDVSMPQVLNNLFENEPLLISKYKYSILLQPTSPLRTEEHIIDSFNQLAKSENSDSLISVETYDNICLKNLVLNKSGFLDEIDSNGYFTTNRQLLPKVYKPNGAIYIFKTEEFLSSGKLISKNTIPFEMKKNESFDIDTYEDYELIKRQFKSI